MLTVTYAFQPDRTGEPTAPIPAMPWSPAIGPDWPAPEAKPGPGWPAVVPRGARR